MLMEGIGTHTTEHLTAVKSPPPPPLPQKEIQAYRLYCLKPRVVFDVFAVLSRVYHSLPMVK